MRRISFALTLALGLVGLVVSVALAIDHLGPAPAYCAEGGCATVRESVWSHPFGVPLPIVGAVFFAATLALAVLAPRSNARRAWSVAGGVMALGFIALQAFVIGAWCELCLVVDASALALAALAIATQELPAVGRRGQGGLAVALAAAVIAPIALSSPAAPPPAPAQVAATALPDVVAREQQPGVLTVVEFIDFECPFCRRLHDRLAAALAQADQPVRVVRKMVPLTAHANALPAAIAWCGADALGKGDAMADALIRAPVHQLTREGCEKIATELGLDLESFRAACADPKTRARIEGDLAAARAAGVKVLPTVFIGGTMFAGASATDAELLTAVKAPAST
jgi:uncharacterized membrane protein